MSIHDTPPPKRSRFVEFLDGDDQPCAVRAEFVEIVNMYTAGGIKNCVQIQTRDSAVLVQATLAEVLAKIEAAL